MAGDDSLAKKTLVVDLDGTLIRTDLLHEALVYLILRSPLKLLKSLPALFRGKARFKAEISKSFTPQAEWLPYNQEVLELIRESKKAGHQVILASASRLEYVEEVNRHLGLFDSVIGSESENMSGSAKAAVLVEKLGIKEFDYVGNSKVDLKVWEVCNHAYVVSDSRALIRKTKNVNDNFSQLVQATSRFLWIRQLRLHQWVKNVLIFVPLLASFSSLNLDVAAKSGLAFAAFGFIASATYVFNDLVDLENDRMHHSKANRPLASGRIPVFRGFLIALFMLLVGLGASWLISTNFFAVILAYLATTISYSFWLKRQVILDCIALAFLYTLRVIAGTYLIEAKLSFWLLAFSVFIFLSLAWVKRYSELETLSILGKTSTNGRGYSVSDLPLVLAFGAASSFCATLIFALYIDSSASAHLYVTPEFAWLAIPVLLYWVGRLWIMAHRGEMHEDPVIFAFRDRASLISVLLIGVIMFIAHIGVSL